MPAKLTIEDMHALADKRGGKCLSVDYIDIRTKLRWECAKKHRWWAVPNSVKNNESWCRKCVGTEPLTLGEMQKIAASRGGKCLSTAYVDNKTHLWWQCRELHTWEATPGEIKKGTWCSQCNRVSIEEMHAIAARHGGACLATEIINNETHLPWRCAQGHEWLATPHDVKNHGTWCQLCRRRARTVVRKIASIEPPPAALPNATLQRFFDEATKLTEPKRTVLLLLPSSGLRPSELVELRLGHIKKKQLKTERGERTAIFFVVGEVEVPLTKAGEQILRHYVQGWRRHRSGIWLFPSTARKPPCDGLQHVSASLISASATEIRKTLGLSGLPHRTMLQTYLTTLFRSGVDASTLADLGWQTATRRPTGS